MEMKICQSCAMPMMDETIFGKNADGLKNEDYCTYCYQDGKFTSETTMEEMVEFCIKPCLEQNVYPDEDTARAAMMGMLPGLKRWSK